jgi:hypothetical protein
MDETRFQMNANTNVPNEWNIIHESNNYIKMPIGGWNVTMNYIFKLIFNMKNYRSCAWMKLSLWMKFTTHVINI